MPHTAGREPLLYYYYYYYYYGNKNIIFVLL